MITVYQGKNSRLLVAIGSDVGITTSSSSNGAGWLEGSEEALEDLCKAIMRAQGRNIKEAPKQPRTLKEGDLITTGALYYEDGF